MGSNVFHTRTLFILLYFQMFYKKNWKKLRLMKVQTCECRSPLIKILCMLVQFLVLLGIFFLSCYYLFMSSPENNSENYHSNISYLTYVTWTVFLLTNLRSRCHKQIYLTLAIHLKVTQNLTFNENKRRKTCSQMQET